SHGTPHSLRKYTVQRYMPIGPTGRMMASCCPARRLKWISRAISCPMYVSKSAKLVQGTGANCGCHQDSRSVNFSGAIPASLSLLARSQPAGRKLSISELFRVVSRFIKSVRCELFSCSLLDQADLNASSTDFLQVLLYPMGFPVKIQSPPIGG